MVHDKTFPKFIYIILKSSNKQLTYFRSYKNKYFTIIKLWLFSVNKKKLFMTFQSLEMADKKSFNYITHWIDNRIS